MNANAPHINTPYCTCTACCAKRRDDRRRLLRSDIRETLTRGACVGFDAKAKRYLYDSDPTEVMHAIMYSMRCNMTGRPATTRNGSRRTQRLALRVMRAAGHPLPSGYSPATLAMIMG